MAGETGETKISDLLEYIAKLKKRLDEKTREVKVLEVFKHKYIDAYYCGWCTAQCALSEREPSISCAECGQEEGKRINEEES